MKAGIYNFEIEQGGKLHKTWAFPIDELDLSDYDGVRMQIRRRPGQPVIWDSGAEEPNNGSIVIAGNNIDLDIPGNKTKDFQFDEAAYDIELYTNADSDNPDKVLKGKILLNREITV